MSLKSMSNQFVVSLIFFQFIDIIIILAGLSAVAAAALLLALAKHNAAGLI